MAGMDEQDSLARIERGAIPLEATRRLAALREQGGLFTSDLSVNGWALSHRLGLRPLSQVMGSSIYQMGYQGAYGRGPAYGGGPTYSGGFMLELDVYTQALNEVRSRALRRLREEAAYVGADAVLEVKTQAGERSLEGGSATLEHTVFGTAVGRDGSHASEPVLTELSVADYSKLVQAGFEPVGIVAWSAVFFAGYAFGTGLASGGVMGTGRNYELREFTQAFYTARERVMAELGDQASALGASGVVGMRIGHTAVPHDLGVAARTGANRGLMVTFNAIGTAIRQSESAPLHPPEMTLDLST
jgi:uncharacterized protein YbjQ (UPF0145 family)